MALTAQALRDLESKLGKIQREGGTLKWTLPNGETIIFDLLSVDSYQPVFDPVYFVNQGAICSADISLTAKPYGRGSSTTLTTHTATTGAPLVFTETGIKGDWSGIGHLRIGNVTNSKRLLVFGVQSRYYDAASTAALFLEAEAGAGSAAVADPGPSGASGGGTNKTMKHVTVGTSGTLSYVLGTALTTPVTQVGTFRVFARVQAASANTGISTVTFKWLREVNGPVIANDDIPIVTSAGAAINGSWVMLDCGLVKIPPPPSSSLGSGGWQGAFYAKSTVGADTVYYDWALLVPADESFARVTFPASFLASGSPVLPATAIVDANDIGIRFNQSSGGTQWTDAAVEGDYLRIPPAGLESRTLRVACVLAGQLSSATLTSTVVDAPNMDAITGTLTYTPRYLVVPSP
jgi:hypothetical protein